MGIFGFGKNKKTATTETSCACGGNSETVDIQNAKIIVLGACCKKSSDTFENVKKAVAEMEIAEEVINVGDIAEIAKFGVMSTPALVINNRVVSMGKLINIEEAKQLIDKSDLQK